MKPIDKPEKKPMPRNAKIVFGIIILVLGYNLFSDWYKKAQDEANWDRHQDKLCRDLRSVDPNFGGTESLKKSCENHY